MKETINYRSTSIICRMILWIGIITIILSVGYMIFNLADADNFISTWKFFIIVGVSFSFIGGILEGNNDKGTSQKTSCIKN